jgi:large conductance mechanosensitive channel
MSNWFKEFREFAVKGNVVDLAIGVIIGAAFGKIVESLVGDIIMPLVGAVVGGLDFSNYYVGLAPTVTAESLEEAKKQGAVFAYGSFMTVALNFLIVACALFFVVKGINKLRRQQAKEPAVPPAPTRQEELLMEIRDTLKSRS